jgi:two-component system alkaline phosphatase synthesis response regulator PhoP
MTGVTVDILIIDDDPWIVELVMMAAEERAWTVQSAPDGASGMKQLETLQPRVILLDVRLPRQNGWATLAEIQSRIPGHPPVIMLTADEMAQADARKNGATAVVRKPFSIRPFLDLLSSFLEPEGQRPQDQA